MERKFDPQFLKDHPQGPWTWTVAERLRAAGFEVRLAGGCVRDLILGRTPHDLDLATSARPEQVEELFERTIDVGKAFGVIRVRGEAVEVEVATFRRDGRYLDGRRPEGVEFSSAREDALRRDFTVNALFLDPWTGEVDDFVGGLRDLEDRVIRAVGIPYERFEEDRLRILRAIRFAAELDFQIESETWRALKEWAPETTKVSPERVREEMGKMWRGRDPGGALRGLEDSGLRAALFPEMPARIDFLDGDIWREALATGMEWTPWALWMAGEGLPAASVIESLETLGRRWRFSRDADQAFADFLKTLRAADEWHALRWGVRAQRLARPGVFWAVRCLSWHRPQEAGWVQDLAAFAAMGALPAPLLRGDDLRRWVTGPDLGAILQEAYCEQIEGAFLDREAALKWWAERRSKGPRGSPKSEGGS